MPLKSHYFEHDKPPYLLLQTHIAQVLQAALFLLDGHTPSIDYPQTRRVLEAVVRCHDLGKGSAAFQAYINNPAAYRGSREEKAHTPLSAVLSVLWGRTRDWPVLDILALTQAVAGHHSGFRAIAALQSYLQSEEGAVLNAQWKGFALDAVKQASGLSGLETLPEDFDEAGVWLFYEQEAREHLENLPPARALAFRLWTQFLFSILLEADKALLALRDVEALYFQTQWTNLSSVLVDKRISELPTTRFDDLRNQARHLVLRRGAEHPEARCFTLTLPTGAGKTLLAATWALRQREAFLRANPETHSPTAPKIIVVLPFLSIIDQTEGEYRRVLGEENKDDGQSHRVAASHSLSERRHQDIEHDRAAEFFLDTWRSDIVITTFDQFLLALFSDKAKHLMRFHRLRDALIILDEVQTLPVKLWDLVNHALQALCGTGNSKVLLMSATQPGLLTPALELAGEAQETVDLFARCRRYRIHFKHRAPLEIDAFIETLPARLRAWLEEGKRVLITLNTRAAAKKIWRALRSQPVPVYLISADLTPRERMDKIQKIKSGAPCIVVSTQTIEAGVDIDMDVVIRDFAPLDALIQVAGRCNRNGAQGDYGGYVEVLCLLSNGKRESCKIYQKQILDISGEVLVGLESIDEDKILELGRRYFAKLQEKKDTGKALTQAFAYWREMENIHSILRPDVGEQVRFIVADDEAGRDLLEQLQAALEQPRWEKHRALQTLAGPLNARSVSVYQRPGFDAEDYTQSDYSDLAERDYFILNHELYYSRESGLEVREEELASCII